MSRHNLSMIPLVLSISLLAWPLSPVRARPINLGAVIRQETMDPAPAPTDPGMESPTDTGGDDGLAVDPKWHPNKALLKGLPVSTKLGPYPLRLPSGLKTKKVSFSNDDFTGVEQFWASSFTSRIMPNTVVGGLVLRLRPDVDTETVGPEQLDALDAMGDTMFIRQRGVVKSDKQEGDVGGVTVTRQYFKFTEPKTGHKFHGFNYIATVDKLVVLVVMIVGEPASTKQLPIMEAGALQFLQEFAKRQ